MKNKPVIVGAPKEDRKKWPRWREKAEAIRLMNSMFSQAVTMRNATDQGMRVRVNEDGVVRTKTVAEALAQADRLDQEAVACFDKLVLDAIEHAKPKGTEVH